MIREEFTRAADWLYHNDYDNPVRLEIYAFLAPYGLHWLTKIQDTPSDAILAEVEKFRKLREEEEEKRKKEIAKEKKRKKRRK